MPRKDAIAKAEYDKQYMQSNAEKLRLYHKEYREKNKEIINQKKQAKVEEYRQYAKEYRINNKQAVAETKKKYINSVRGYINCYVANKRSEKLQRTPKWLTNIDLEDIKNKYYLANMKTKLTGETWHVDHIIPLKGKYVSGLHVPSNLQVIKSMENFKKSNVFKVEYA